MIQSLLFNYRKTVILKYKLLPREASRRHQKQMPVPPQLVPFDGDKHQLFPELLPVDGAAHPISQGAACYPKLILTDCQTDRRSTKLAAQFRGTRPNCNTCNACAHKDLDPNARCSIAASCSNSLSVVHEAKSESGTGKGQNHKANKAICEVKSQSRKWQCQKHRENSWEAEYTMNKWLEQLSRQTRRTGRQLDTGAQNMGAEVPQQNYGFPFEALSSTCPKASKKAWYSALLFI